MQMCWHAPCIRCRVQQVLHWFGRVIGGLSFVWQISDWLDSCHVDVRQTTGRNGGSRAYVDCRCDDVDRGCTREEQQVRE